MADFVQQWVNEDDLLLIRLLNEISPHLEVGSCEDFVALALEEVHVSFLQTKVGINYGSLDLYAEAY